MGSKILINAIDPEEVRIAKVMDGRMEEFQIETAGREILHGNIYKAIITRIEPSLQAVFVEFGGERHGFLQQHEIHSDFYLENSSGDRSLQSLVKNGQEVMVQVTKDPIMKKGAMLTTYISLPGRHIVLMPGTQTRGISRKIEDEEERRRLKELLQTINLPEGFGVIVRTAGMGCTKAQLAKDLNYLLRLWRSIQSKAVRETAPATLYKERSLSVRSIRDYFTPDVVEILIDDEGVYQEVKSFMGIISPRHQRIVKHYTADKPIFAKYQLEDQIATIFENRVALKSGGSIVIEQTEALVAIDVNSGRSTKERDLEQTALTTNLEAAEEVARQLRLRDLGGLIVVDFIDMRDQKNRNAVERALREHVKRDKARVRIGRISQFGLLEMARQRLAPSIDLGSLIPCPFCRGKGLTASTETLALRFLRQLKMMTRKSGLQRVHGSVPQAVADYLLNRKRKEISDLEMQRGFALTIEGSAELAPHECRIDCDPQC
ncbi:Rne/Rng family ribonuclease [Desulfatitalea alkaliphila]|uniref:Ribonuclease G n=1 Tax=Desulfatitalea alkaliphila TaxID=2929485 RepID=A0AA41R6X1_9BACT|nr:Rne/Rng family ribonuclease [Desulfatitalea alkaliphila]MCJ8502548.1 Rne/Rng family ribonuclease [Desulfatitalea alkaliphila]